MGSSYGENLKLTIFGQSHSPAIGVTVEGIPAGSRIDIDELQRFMARRAPGRNELSTKRKEADKPEFVSGVINDPDGNSDILLTCGVPLTALIYNHDTRSSDYSELKRVPRPGHADYTAEIKYKGFQDYKGGGHFSGRLTAPLCIVGGICLQLLRQKGINIYARIISVYDVEDQKTAADITEKEWKDIKEKEFPVFSDEKGARMQERILEAKEDQDSVGGVIECMVFGVPQGLGDPIFGGMENRISQIVFGIPAVKGIEFGAGFKSAQMKGSVSNDPFATENGRVVTVTNNAGGILGGITNGMPIVFRTAVKPTPSIGKQQRSIDMETMESKELNVRGRHDPCIVQRAVPVMEAAAAIAVFDAYLSRD